MLNLLRSIIPNDYARALVLKGLRWAGAAAAGAMVPWLVKHGVSAADAASIAAAVAALILGGGSALFSILDANKVDAQQKTAVASTAAVVASAPPETQAVIASQATQALAQGDGASKRLDATIAALKAGTA